AARSSGHSPPSVAGKLWSDPPCLHRMPSRPGDHDYVSAAHAGTRRVRSSHYTRLRSLAFFLCHGRIGEVLGVRGGRERASRYIDSPARKAVNPTFPGSISGTYSNLRFAVALPRDAPG